MAEGLKNPKQHRKMTKMLAKLWDAEGSEPFRDQHLLIRVGSRLDHQKYDKEGKRGWEKFAVELGRVYGRFLSSGNPHQQVARKHLDILSVLLTKFDPGGALASASNMAAEDAAAAAGSNASSQKSNGTPAKRKKDSDVDPMKVPLKRKKVRDESTSTATQSGGEVTLAQREERSMNMLKTYLSKEFHVTDTDELLAKVKARATKRKSEDRYTVVFIINGKTLRTKLDVAKHLELTGDTVKSTGIVSKTNAAVPKKKSVTINKGRPRTQRDLENERKRLQKELDKLLKTHVKATKVLVDHKSEQYSERYPIDDDLLYEELKEADPKFKPQLARDVSVDISPREFPGIPEYAIPDVLMVWDFLGTFHRTLALTPVSLGDFCAALNHKPPPSTQQSKLQSNLKSKDKINGDNDDNVDDEEEHEFEGASNAVTMDNTALQGIPVFLAESHIALLKLIFADVRSDEWWWSTLPDESDVVESTPKQSQFETNDAVKKDDSDSDDDEEDDEDSEDEESQGQQQNDEDLPQQIEQGVSFVVPPSIIDLLLPPNKPSSTDPIIVSPMTWPYLTAVIARRYINHLKKLRSEADDTVRHKRCVGGAHRFNKDNVKNENHNIRNNGIKGINGSLLDSKSQMERHSISISRIFSECFCDVNSTNDNKEGASQVSMSSTAANVESAIELLCNPLLVNFQSSPCSGNNETNNDNKSFSSSSSSMGGVYSTLSAHQRLCLLRILIEAAYDTNRVSTLIEDNFKARTSALKSLENEQRKSKKLAREEQQRDEELAREYLASDVRTEFCRAKRDELIAVARGGNNDELKQRLEDATDEELVQQMLDDESKAEYDALPNEKSFSKVDVVAMATKIQEAAAFDTHSLTVLSLDEIVAREGEKIDAILEEIDDLNGGTTGSNSPGENSELHIDRSVRMRISKLRRELNRLQNLQETLPAARANAICILNEALEEFGGSNGGSAAIKAYRYAIRVGKQAKLTGNFDDGLVEDEEDGAWALDLFRDVVMEHRASEKRKKIIDLQRDLVIKRDKCFVRTEPLGCDQFRDVYWYFKDASSGSSDRVSVWVEQQEMETARTIGADDCEEDFCLEKEAKDTEQSNRTSFTTFSRKEYHHSGRIRALPYKTWGCYANDISLRKVIRKLDERGKREVSLKMRLKEIMDQSSSSPSTTNVDSSGITDKIQLEGDMDAVRVAKERYSNPLALASFIDNGDSNNYDRLDSFMKCRIRMKVYENGTYEMGTVTGWKMKNVEKDDQEGGQAESNANGEPSYSHRQDHDNQNMPLWKVVIDGDGQEVFLSGDDVITGLIVARKWMNMSLKNKPNDEGHHLDDNQYYYEQDSQIFSYHNTLGKYCGRNADDAQIASTPFALSKIMLRKESEMYSKLKNRVMENRWGRANTGFRNNWIQTLRDEGHKMEVVRTCLVSLEGAIFDLIETMYAETSNNHNSDGYQDSMTITPSSEVTTTTKDMLVDAVFRSDIELESIGQQKIISLWTSKEVRSVFLAILKYSEDVGVLALGLDLLCRNCFAFIDANTVKKASRSNKGRVVEEYYYVDEFNQPHSATSTTGGGFGMGTSMNMRRTSSRRKSNWQQQQEGFYTDFF